jgi:hypothetical protein
MPKKTLRKYLRKSIRRNRNLSKKKHSYKKNNYKRKNTFKEKKIKRNLKLGGMNYSFNEQTDEEQTAEEQTAEERAIAAAPPALREQLWPQPQPAQPALRAFPSKTLNTMNSISGQIFGDVEDINNMYKPHQHFLPGLRQAQMQTDARWMPTAIAMAYQKVKDANSLTDDEYRLILNDHLLIHKNNNDLNDDDYKLILEEPTTVNLIDSCIRIWQSVEPAEE